MPSALLDGNGEDFMRANLCPNRATNDNDNHVEVK